MKPGFSIVGCGRLGITLAKVLSEKGYPAKGFASRSLTSAQKAAELSGSDNAGTDPLSATRDADIIFITTPDGLIGSVCQSMAKSGAFRSDHIVFHCSGSLPSTLLESAKDSGATIGSIHPLQSFATVHLDRNPFEGIIVAVEGDEKAVALGLDIARDLGSKGLTIKTQAKTMYHASAVVASNFMVTLVDFAYQLLSVAGIDSKDAYAVLGPLIEGTLANIKQVGPVHALTGPIVRGDVGTVSDHIREITEKTPQLLELYRILGKHTVEIAKKRGSLTEESLDGLTQLLEAHGK
ncbi:MAG: DUF2520 domain-containing protein [Desulfobacteraceae bacterium]|jgi:predicted short-subunit dehydrogenase-like oxidoreductase (DUF2520 family)